MSDPLSTLALATGGAFLGKFVGPAAESLGKVAWERAQQLGTKATALLAAVGREPQPVEPKLLVPLVQAASLETDESLADKWAALLANSADSASRQVIKPAFIEILRQLTSEEGVLLSKLFDEADILRKATNIAPEGMKPQDRKERTLDTLLDLFQERTAFTDKRGAARHSGDELAEMQNFDAMVDNLLRQQVVIPAAPLRPFVGGSTSPDSYRSRTAKVYFTSLGYDFMLAVSPPTP
jgi:hypothetical protein